MPQVLQAALDGEEAGWCRLIITQRREEKVGCWAEAPRLSFLTRVLTRLRGPSSRCLPQPGALCCIGEAVPACSCS